MLPGRSGSNGLIRDNSKLRNFAVIQQSNFLFYDQFDLAAPVQLGHSFIRKGIDL